MVVFWLRASDGAVMGSDPEGSCLINSSGGFVRSRAAIASATTRTISGSFVETTGRARTASRPSKTTTYSKAFTAEGWPIGAPALNGYPGKGGRTLYFFILA